MSTGQEVDPGAAAPAYVPAAFMSYVRFDDQHANGRITQFREQLGREVRAQTGEEFAIFQDRNDIAWGQNWQRRINEALDAATLLLVIITPSLFRSGACRAEVNRFLERERALDRQDLILPVYYISAREMDDPRLQETDEMARLLASRQYADWREMRFRPFTSPPVRKAIAELAARMRDTFWHRPAVPSSGTAEPTPTPVTTSSASGPTTSAKPVFPVYSDAGATTNHYIPSGYMGDIGDIGIDEACTAVVHSGTTSIRVTYSAKGSGPHECSYSPPCKWAGVYWQEPPDNWGTNAGWANRGYDLSGYRSLLFWARADEPTSIDFQVGGIDKPYGDSMKTAKVISAQLSREWREYRIDLGNADLSHIIGGFAWTTNWHTNPGGCTFYLDEIRFE